MGVTLHSGDLRERIELFAPPTTQDARGQIVGNYTSQGSYWAAAAPLTGREFFAAGQQQVHSEIRFRLRYSAAAAAALATWRVLWRGTWYELTAHAIDTGGARVQLELMAARVAGAGVPA